MKSQKSLLSLFRANAGRSTHIQPGYTKNPFGYWPSKVKKIEKYGEF